MPTRAVPTALIIDSRELRRSGVLGILSDWAENKGIELVAPDPDDAIAELDSPHHCKVIVLSVGSQSLKEREHQQRLRVLQALAPDVPIVVMSDREEPAEVIGALVAGVRGFLPSNMSPELALQAISFIMSGGSYFPPAALRNLPAAPRTVDEAPDGGSAGRRLERPTPPQHRETPQRHEESDDEARGAIMTNRQMEVLHLLKDGQPNKVIARQLGMTEATVKVHVRQIMRKLGASNRTQAALCAVAVPECTSASREGDDADDGEPPRGRRRPPSPPTQMWAAE